MFDGDFLDFLGQIPPVVTIAFCGFMLLLVISLGLLVNMSARRRGRREAKPRAGNAPAAPSALPVENDLPDIDLLVGAEQSLPNSEPVAVATPARVPAASPARRPGTYWLELSDGRRVEAADVLTISRGLADGALIVQIGAKSYGHVADIADAEARHRLKAALRELAQQITVTPRETQSASEVAAVAPVAAPEPPQPPPAASAPAAPMPASDGSWNLPNFAEMANEPLKLRGGKPKQAVPEINIAGAIEAYLQHKLHTTAGFEQRRLHIHSAPGGGVRIEVDGRFYEAVSDIEDTATRDFMAQAIQEWQANQ